MRTKSLLIEVAPAEVFLQPAIESDEQVAAPHFLDFQLGFASPAVAPGDGRDGPGVAANNRLERQFDGDVEMRRKERTAAFDNGAPVALNALVKSFKGTLKRTRRKRLARRLMYSLRTG